MDLNSMRSQQWLDGRRNGIKFAVSWLRDRAQRMRDEHARQILYSASFNLGKDAKTSVRSSDVELETHKSRGVEEDES